MTPEQILYMRMVDSRMILHPGTLDSLREALHDGNIYFFKQDGEILGFVTWYFEGDALIMNNLCVDDADKTIEKFFGLRKLLHERFSHMNKIKWYSERKQKPFEVQFSQGDLCPVQK